MNDFKSNRFPAKAPERTPDRTPQRATERDPEKAPAMAPESMPQRENTNRRNGYFETNKNMVSFIHLKKFKNFTLQNLTPQTLCTQ